MQEIANWFREELQNLIDRYKNKIPIPTIMSIAQDTFHKTLSIKYHPESYQKAINYFMQSTGFNKLDLEGKWKSLEDIKNEQVGKAIAKELTSNIELQGQGYAKGFPIIDELEGDWKCESDINKPM